jgi:hypothetical protein
MLVQKLCNNVFPESKRDTTIVLTPSIDFLIGVRPEEITQETGIGDIGRPNNTFYLVQTGELGAKTTVHAKDLFINHGGTGKTVEAIGKSLPELNSESSLALIVKSVNTVDRCTFMVTTENEKVLGVLDLVGKQKTNGLQTLLTTIHVVSKEYVIRLRWESTIFKQAQKIVVLAVNVTANLDRSLQLEEHRLSNQKITAAEAEHFNLSL